VKTRDLLVFVVVCDVFMAAAGIPLERVTLRAIAHPTDRHTLAMLLAANIALFVVCVGGFLATTIAGSRGLHYAVTRFAKSFARSRSTR